MTLGNFLISKFAPRQMRDVTMGGTFFYERWTPLGSVPTGVGTNVDGFDGFDLQFPRRRRDATTGGTFFYKPWTPLGSVPTGVGTNVDGFDLQFPRQRRDVTTGGTFFYKRWIPLGSVPTGPAQLKIEGIHFSGNGPAANTKLT